jgi:2-amino-4-hydroxy-6-hydroxymethyldihydropteridine diphosphokinase
LNAGNHQVCLLLGSNIEPVKNLPAALELLRHQITILKVSSVWQTPPVGTDGPNFLNMAILVETGLPADALKQKVLRPLESSLGRIRSADKNAPRPMDIDIILYDDLLLDPTLFQLAYRAVPVAEIMPHLVSGEGETLQAASTRLAKVASIQLKDGLVLLP